MGKLDGKIALVTGASRGIGRAIALRLAADGAEVIINYASSEMEAQMLVKQVEHKGGLACKLRGDLRDLDSLDAMFAEIKALYGGLDILVNNAGRAGGYPNSMLHLITPETFDSIFSLNARGTFFVIQKAVAMMRDDGRVISVSSVSARGRLPGQSAYGGSKAAIDAFTRNLAPELAPRRITINSVQPGVIDTEDVAKRLDAEARQKLIDWIPLNRMGETRDVADVIAFLASDDSRWITGQEILLTGGFI